MDDGWKTREQLLVELADLRVRLSQLEGSDSESAHGSKPQRRQVEQQLAELTCLYGISALVESRGDSLDDLLSGVVELIPPACQEPELAGARIVLGDETYAAKGFRQTPWRQARDILASGRPVGTLEVCYLEQPRESGQILVEQDRTLISLIAERLGRILERLGAAAERDAALVELRSAQEHLKRRVEELTAIHSSGQRLQRLGAPQSVAQAIIDMLEEMLDYEYAAVLLIDKATGRLIPYALSRQRQPRGFVEADRAYVESHGLQVGQGITGWVAETGQSVCLGDVRSDPRYYPMRDDIRSELCVPLRSGDQVLGVVNVESTRVQAYSSADQRVLETIASQMVIAIQNSDLYQELRLQSRELEERVAERTAELSALNERLQDEVSHRVVAEERLTRRVRELDALHKTSVAITAQTDLPTLFDLILERSVELVDAGMATLTLKRPGGQVLEIVAARNLPSQTIGVKIKPGEGLAGRVAQTGETLAVPDYGRWQGQVASPNAPPLARALGVPLRVGKRVIGAITILDSEQTGAFDEDEIQLASLLADQAAIAVENARLLAQALQELELRREAEESLRWSDRALRVLSESGRILGQSTDESLLLRDLCQTAVDTGGYRLAWVGFAEHDEGKTVRPVAQAGYEEGYLDTLQITWADEERGRGPTGTAIRTQRPCASRNMQEDPEFAPWREEAIRRGYRSSIALPLLAGDRCLGALNIYAAEPNSFHPTETELLTQMAKDLAYGLEALRIRVERRQALDSLDQKAQDLARSQQLISALSRVAARIEIQRDPSQVFDTLGSELAKLGLTSLTALQVPGGPDLRIRHTSIESRHLAAASRLGGLAIMDLPIPGDSWPAREVMDGGRPLFVEDPTTIGRALLPDTEPEAVARAFRFAGITTETPALCLPLASGGRTTGILVVWGPDLREADTEAFTVFAGQVAGSLDNARLLRDEQQRATELSTLLEASRAISSGLDLDETLTRIAQQAVLATGAEGCTLSRWDREADSVITWIDRRRDGSEGEKPGTTYALSDFPETRAVLETAQPCLVSVSDPDADPAEVAHMLRDGMTSVLMLPLAAGERVLGLLEVDLASPDSEFSDAQIRLAQALADQAGIAIDNTQLAREASEIEVFRELDRLRSELFASVSHELRTPLGLIKIHASTLLREDVEIDDGTTREFLAAIEDEADKLGLLVENLLSLSQIEGERLRLALYPIDLGALAQKASASIALQFPDRRFQHDFPDEPLVAEVDPRRMEQVLRNLLDNAAKYSRVGRTVIVRGRQMEGGILLQVTDQGIGIPPESAERVFERFYRVDNETTRRTRGTGLGLAVCQEIVGAHGGEIWVDSTLGQGSTFSVSLPAGDA